MKDKQQNPYEHYAESVASGHLIDEMEYRLVPVEALQGENYRAAAVNLFYQHYSANDSEFVDFDDPVSEAWDVVKREH